MKVLAFGEVMMRLSVPNHRLIHQSDQLDMMFRGTGFNFLSGVTNFGIQTRLLTAVPDNNLGFSAKLAARKYIDDTHHIVSFGNHMGSYILEMGFGHRPSEVTYLDRSLSSYNLKVFTDDEFEQALDGVSHVHVCGISLSTSDISQKNVLNLIRIAKRKAVKVIFDCNYRPRIADAKDLKSVYKEVVSATDILFGSKRDVVELLEYPDQEDVESLFTSFVKDFNLEVFAGTHKDASSYKGFLVMGETYFESKDYNITQILDPIGTGDAYASRLLAGILKHEAGQVIVNKATASGVLAHTTYGDVVVITEEMIASILEEESNRVKR